MGRSWASFVMFMLCFAVGCGGTAKREDSSVAKTESGSGPKCEPGRCLPDISQLIQQHRSQARACIDDARKTQPDLAGQLFINFEIDPTGQVASTSQGVQDNQISDPDVVACISAVVQAIKFPGSPSGKTTRAYHMFEFARRGK
jgi:hypothetical protein